MEILINNNHNKVIFSNNNLPNNIQINNQSTWVNHILMHNNNSHILIQTLNNTMEINNFKIKIFLNSNNTKRITNNSNNLKV